MISQSSIILSENYFFAHLFLLFFLSSIGIFATKTTYCDINEIFIINKCYNHELLITKKVPYSKTTNNDDDDPKGKRSKLFIIYDVNPVEGFNLRRDVYIRMATFVYSMRESKKYVVNLVLPPFVANKMYHWRSHRNRDRIFWGEFFDLSSLREFAKILDFNEFIEGKFVQFNFFNLK